MSGHSGGCDARDAEHLSGFDCPDCGHSAMAHYRNPTCRHWATCRCNADPLCWCGVLASKHITPPASTDTTGGAE